MAFRWPWQHAGDNGWFASSGKGTASDPAVPLFDGGPASQAELLAGLDRFSATKESIDELVVQLKISNGYMSHAFDIEINEEDL
jgi:hypothetical protein